MSENYQIKLYGSFDVFDASGNSCAPPSQKGCALLSLLAAAANYKRSRAWLMAMLWGRVPKEQASASLRSCIHALRKHFSSSDALVHSDRSNVWLQPNTQLLETVGHSREEFLEGIDIDEEGFEDWLRQRRSESDLLVAEPMLVADPPEPPAHRTLQPHLVVLPVSAFRDEDRLVGDTIMDIIVRTTVQLGFLDVLDLREGLDAQIHASSSLPRLGLVLRLLRIGEDYSLSVLLKQMEDGKVVWTGWYSDNTARGIASCSSRLKAFASEVANTVIDRVSKDTRLRQPGHLFGAIHNVLSHSRTGQVEARRILTDMASESGVARAWLMYTFAVAHAERHGGLEVDALEELNEHCILANSSEPDNPIVQAIAGHMHAFVFRNSARADDHHATARKTGWSHPIVWTLSAMHENYACRPDHAYKYSGRAVALSANSPYQFFFQGPHSISSSLTGRHYEAVELSKRVLEKKPVLLAAMRHMAASQILIGDIKEARKTVESIRARDPRFLVGELADSDYPLPSASSVELIEYALTQANMGKPYINL